MENKDVTIGKKELASKILKTLLYGRIRLERSPKYGYIVSWRGNKEIFWVQWSKFETIYKTFKDIVELTNKTPSR